MGHSSEVRFCRGVRGRSGTRTGGRSIGIDRQDGYRDCPPKYHLAWLFSDGLGRIRIDIATSEKSITMEGLRSVSRHQFGFVDGSGKEVIHPKFERATNFKQGRAFAMLPGSRRLGIIDKRGSIVHEPEYDQASEFHEGLAAACVNGMWGYVDTGGKWIIAPEFSSAGDFRHDLARVSWSDGYGYIDRSGTAVWKATAKKSP